ncbi:MAG: glycosyltransferase family 4 protein [Candidatus Hodarchaeota archaeon]
MPKISFLSHLDLNLYLFRLPIMKELVKRNWEVFALTPPGKYSPKFQEYGIEHISYEIRRGSLNPLLEVKTILEIYRILKRIKPLILHTFMAKPNIYGTIAGKVANVPIIINTITGLGSFYIENNLKSQIVRVIINILFKFAFLFSNHVIFQNSDDLKYFINSGLLTRAKASVIKGSGIDTRQFSPQYINTATLMKLKKELNLSKKKVVLTIGRLTKHKGIFEYCRAAQKIKTSSLEPVEFLVVGYFDKGNPFCINRKDFNNFIQKKVIKFLGRREDIRELIALCDLFVLPSYQEGIPRTLIEAASMGKPIVTTNTIGCREVVEHEKNGILIPPKNIDALAEAIKCLIKNKNECKKFGQYSRKKAIKEFDINLVIDKSINIYKELIEKRTGNKGVNSILF